MSTAEIVGFKICPVHGTWVLTPANRFHITAKRLTLDVLPSGTNNMAEILGIASGIAGLLSLTIETYRISANYISGVHNASKLVKDLLRELSALKKVLVDLDDLIAGVDEDVVSRLCLDNTIEHNDFDTRLFDTLER
jgi:hypothetical protein